MLPPEERARILLADVCNQYLTKEKQVYVEGRLTSRTYQTQSGETRFTYSFRR